MGLRMVGWVDHVFGYEGGYMVTDEVAGPGHCVVGSSRDQSAPLFVPPGLDLGSVILGFHGQPLCDNAGTRLWIWDAKTQQHISWFMALSVSMALMACSDAVSNEGQAFYGL
jgi:hypothetical protein